ncbi:MAG: hypothetical protein EOO86_10200 [Pedobacter sp.]|nr:MAG: hypothetical protein EOO86_10200 [Pedobacter sp.]
MAINTTNKTYHLLIDAVRAAGMGLGIYLTKPTLEKRLSKSFNLVDASVNKTLKHAPERKLSNPISFELAGLGGIAAYKIYKGLKKKKKANIVEGIFLTTVMAAALVYTINLATTKSANK